MTKHLAQLLTQAPSPQRFRAIFGSLSKSREEEGFEEILAQVAECLESWPDSCRALEWRIDADEDSEDRFLTQSHALYGLVRAFSIEEDSTQDLNAYLDAFFQAPDVSGIRHLNLCWFTTQPTPEHLARWFGPKRGLLSLTLWFGDLGDAHGQALAACPGLSSLQELKLSGHRMHLRGLQQLAASPHLTGLRRFHIGELPGDVHWARHKDILGERYFSAGEALSLAEGMPHLESLLAVGGAVPAHQRSWTEPPPRSVQSRVEELLAALQSDDAAYPFDEQSAAFRWLAPGERLKRAAHWEDWTSAFGLGFVDGPPQFEDGQLRAPCAFRAQGRIQDLPPVPTHAQGQAWFQVFFARAGLSLEVDSQGLLWLHPERCEQSSDLVRFYQALELAEQAFGGRNVDLSCTPWHEIMGGVLEDYGMRSILTWPLAKHAFGARGELPPLGQSFTLRGDPFPLRSALERLGLTLLGKGEQVVLRRL